MMERRGLIDLSVKISLCKQSDLLSIHRSGLYDQAIG